MLKIQSKIVLFSLLFLLSNFYSYAQNLVLNPSFEQTANGCAGIIPAEGMIDLIDWDNVSNNTPADTCSTPDLFSTCNASLGVTGVPSNALGYQCPRTGEKYAGFITYDVTGSYREYLQGKLSTPLQAGQIYCVAMFVSLADGVPFATNNIGVHFANTHQTWNAPCFSPFTPVPLTPQLNYTCVFTDTTWVRLQWDYVAVGGEQYIIIGNFFNNGATTTANTGQPAFPNPFGYYYVDDVSVEAGSCCQVDIQIAGNTDCDSWLADSGSGYDASFCVTDASINLTATSAMNGATCSSTPVSGTWSGTGITNASLGTFNPSVAGSGVHTITFTSTMGCADTVSINVNSCSVLTVCKESNGDLTVSGGTGPYTWDNWATTTITPANQTDCTTCGGTWNPGFPPIVPPSCSVSSCSTPGYVNFATGTTVTPPGGATQIQVTDGGGNVLEITNLSTLPNCSASCDATITAAGPFCINAAAVNLTAAETGGTWSGPGITNASNGTFNPATAGVGSHTITYTLGCGDVDIETIVVNTLDNAVFSYASGSYCLTDANPTPTITGLAGGTFTINNSGVINASTGVINIAGSGVGSYTVTYTTNGTCPNSATFNVTITSSTDATITQAGPFCQNATAINLSAVSPGGTWTGTGITDGTLGTFNPTTAGVGNHVITYTITGACGAVDTMTIVVNPSSDASFTYPSGSYCLSDPNPTPSITGTVGGTFTINNSGVINASTGVINLSGSGLGSFVVTYTTSGACPDTNTFNITITNTTNATITQAGPFCQNASTVNLSAVSPGGTWSGNGITDGTTGTFNPTTAGVGSHVITYTISGSCGSVDTMTIVVNATDNPAFSYASTSFCLTDANPTPIITGLAGGIFTINNGGVINASTGLINITSSGTGSFTVTYTTNGSCPNAQTFNITINNCTNPLPVANFAASQTNICEGACISFTDMSASSAVGGITSWAWTFTGATPSSSISQNPINICYNTPGTYQVVLTVTDANGSDDETKVGYITVSSCTPPTAGFVMGDSTICAGECVVFGNTSVGATSWQWTFENGTPLSSTNQNPGSVCFNVAGTQEVKLIVSNSYGVDSISNTITVLEPQQVILGNDTSIQWGQSVSLTATGVINGVYT
ncbi:MAG: PKD domain-containing protein [Flavobacteriales bacterium]|nr:PKD domain-containing protein [Flavobacteriales bacterium]